MWVLYGGSIIVQLFSGGHTHQKAPSGWTLWRNPGKDANFTKLSAMGNHVGTTTLPAVNQSTSMERYHSVPRSTSVGRGVGQFRTQTGMSVSMQRRYTKQNREEKGRLLSSACCDFLVHWRWGRRVLCWLPGWIRLVTENRQKRPHPTGLETD